MCDAEALMTPCRNVDLETRPKLALTDNIPSVGWHRL